MTTPWEKKVVPGRQSVSGSSAMNHSNTARQREQEDVVKAMTQPLSTERAMEGWTDVMMYGRARVCVCVCACVCARVRVRARACVLAEFIDAA